MAFFSNDGYDPIGFYIIIKSGLVGVMVVLAFAQLCPELLAAEYPLRFMNLPGAYTIGCLSLIFDAVGVGHCAWFVYFVTRKLCCRAKKPDDATTAEGAPAAATAIEEAKSKPTVVRVNSAEVRALQPGPLSPPPPLIAAPPLPRPVPLPRSSPRRRRTGPPARRRRTTTAGRFERPRSSARIPRTPARIVREPPLLAVRAT